VLRHPHQVVVEGLLRVGVDRHRRRLAVAEVRDDVASQVVETVVGEAKAAGREERVAPALGLGRFLENQHRSPCFAGGERGAEGRIAPSDHRDIVRPGCGHDVPRVASTTMARPSAIRYQPKITYVWVCTQRRIHQTTMNATMADTI